MSKQKNNIKQDLSKRAVRLNKRGVYRGPSHITTDHYNTPPDFFPDEPTQEILINIVRAGYQLSCENLTHPQFWQDSWTTCPICGARRDKDGLWPHEPEQ